MPVVTLPRMPQSVQQVLGPDAAEDFIQWFDVILVERAVRRDEYREVLSRLDILEHDVSEVRAGLMDLHRTMDERFDRVNERFDRMNERFERLEARTDERLAQMQAQMNERFDRMNERFDRMNERFDQMYERITTMMRWTVGTLALLGTIMTILMAIAQFN